MSEFTQQWPKTSHLHRGHLTNYYKHNTPCTVSEKLDGSNFSVTSQGVIASRRKVVLVRPDADTLSGFKFIGASLAKPS